jgi:HPt (histidine-containing phosphotransfer) domain-containing protein
MQDALREDARSRPAQSSRTLPDVTTAIGALWERFKGVAFDRLEVVEAAAIAQLEGRLDAAGRRRAEREAHKLAGSVGTFGFGEGSRIAREIELLLQGPLGETQTLRLSDLTVALRRTLESRSGSRTSLAPSPRAPRTNEASGRDVRPLLLVLDADARNATRLVEAGLDRMRVERRQC